MYFFKSLTASSGSEHHRDCTARISVKWKDDLNILRSFKTFDILNVSNWTVYQTENPEEDPDHICDRTVSLKQQHFDNTLKIYKTFDMTTNSYD